MLAKAVLNVYVHFCKLFVLLGQVYVLSSLQFSHSSVGDAFIVVVFLVANDSHVMKLIQLIV